MTGTIQNRESFLNNIAGQLGRERLKQPIKKPEWKYNPQDKVLADATADELVEVLKTHCEKINTTVVTTTKAGLSVALNEVVQKYGGGPVVSWKDERFTQWGLQDLFKNEWPNQGLEYDEWDYMKGDDNIQRAEQANVGITISEVTLAESATVVLFSSKDRGRTVSFLPKTYIALVPKSTIVPRMTQAASKMRELHKDGNHVPACVNFISGPSNSADIELQLVVGVHGPFKATYILIDDL